MVNQLYWYMKVGQTYSPEINSFLACFLPAVVTRCSVKFSMRSTTQDVINLDKLSKICFVDAAWAALLLLIFELVSLFGSVAACCGDERSSGGCVGARFGWHRSSNDSRNLFSDCSSHSAGGTAASLYLQQQKRFIFWVKQEIQLTLLLKAYFGQWARFDLAKWNG